MHKYSLPDSAGVGEEVKERKGDGREKTVAAPSDDGIDGKSHTESLDELFSRILRTSLNRCANEQEEAAVAAKEAVLESHASEAAAAPSDDDIDVNSYSVEAFKSRVEGSLERLQTCLNIEARAGGNSRQDQQAIGLGIRQITELQTKINNFFSHPTKSALIEFEGCVDNTVRTVWHSRWVASLINTSLQEIKESLAEIKEDLQEAESCPAETAPFFVANPRFPHRSSIFASAEGVFGEDDFEAAADQESLELTHKHSR